MFNIPDTRRLARIPDLYSTDWTPILDKIVHLHFFIANSDWYIIEYDGKDTFFGYAILNGDTQCSEFGYISFRELQELRNKVWGQIDCELAKYWEPQMIKHIQRLMFLKDK